MTVATETKSFIETQFPVSKLSKECYKERKSHETQTLTSLGKWWGRKPLILVRATLLGLLMPVSNDPKEDRRIFLKILTMDDDGFSQRCKGLTQQAIFERLNDTERRRFFLDQGGASIPKLKDRVLKREAEALALSKLNYDQKIEVSARPEEIDGPSADAWREINAHFGSDASSLSELFRQLGIRRFGKVPRVGDAFCGGGSIPFEAARMGMNVTASDLNPVGALLTWAGLHIVGGGRNVAQAVRTAQEEIYRAVDNRVRELGFESNDQGQRADAFFYCVEVTCPESGWKVPLAPSWIIGKRSGTVARLHPNEETKSYDIEVVRVGKGKNLEKEASPGTVQSGYLVHPMSRAKTKLAYLRDRDGLRLWEKAEIAPRPADVFQERLYCIRWTEQTEQSNGREKRIRHYVAPSVPDIERERSVISYVLEMLPGWHAKGYVPSAEIESGAKTDEPIRTRGWTHWHHLFCPRQLLILGLAMEEIDRRWAAGDFSLEQTVGCLLFLGVFAEKNSRLCGVHPSRDGISHVFTNQALNTQIQYGCYGMWGFENCFLTFPDTSVPFAEFSVVAKDAREIAVTSDIWITDPPYADAVNYHELSEYFLAWYQQRIPTLFQTWYSDSKRALAIRGAGDDFRSNMVECYRNLANHMPEDGLQVVMFTHQDAAVWADLAMILWASGLRVTGAWCVATETDTALKKGNYVQGTVLLILRKQTGTDEAFLDELYPLVEEEVKSQLASMLELDDEDDPNFGDTDYQLAAYAAALRVLTSYKGIEDIDIAYELSKTRGKGEASPIEAIIEDAVKTACDYLVPKGMDEFTWKTLTAEERFYLKGLDLESHGEYRTGAYQELARGFGLREYKDFLGNAKANETRLKTPTEFGRRMLGGAGFGASLVRQALFAIRETVSSGDAQSGKNWLRNEVANYWNERQRLLAILRYLARYEHTIPAWEKDAGAAGVVAGAVENDHA